MKLRSGLTLVLMGLVLFMGGLVEGQPTPKGLKNKKHEPEVGHSRAVTMVRRLGGRVKIDKNSPGNPIVEVSLVGSGLTDTGFTEFAGLTYLKRLYVSKTFVTDAIEPNFEDLLDLQVIWLGRTAIGNDTLAALNELEELREVDVSHCPGVHDLSLPDLLDPPLPELRKLWLSGDAGVSDLSLGLILAQPSLRVVYIGRSGISAGGAAALQLARPDLTIIRRL